MARLLTDLTDDDNSDTTSYWAELETLCLDETKGDARMNAASIAWGELVAA